MNHPDLLISRTGATLSVTLNRPDKLNAIHNDMALSLLQVIDAAAGDDNVRVLLLRGAGRAFCAGRDVSAPPTEDDLVLAKDSATVLIDSLSLEFMGGAEIDYVDDLIGQSFQIRNPNAVAGCGCGTSFSVA